MSFDKCMYLSISNPFQNVEHYHHLRKFPHTLSQAISSPCSSTAPNQRTTVVIVCYNGLVLLF